MNALNYQDLFENLGDGLYFVDRNRRITRWNRAAEQISGYRSSEVLGRRCSASLLQHVDAEGRPLCRKHCPLSRTMGDAQNRNGLIYLRHRDGHRVPVSVRTMPLCNEAGEVVGGAELFTDVSEPGTNRQRIEELEELTGLDTLTRLANRRYLEAQGELRLAELTSYGTPLGLVFIDVDRFRNFNDHYGRNAGDQALKVIAETLAASARAFDLFGRWSGEEFVGLIRNVDRDELGLVAERCRALVSQSWTRVPGGGRRLTISLGAALARSGETLAELVGRAEALMRSSKRQGRNRVTVESA